jgi:hypothetical protein
MSLLRPSFETLASQAPQDEVSIPFAGSGGIAREGGCEYISDLILGSAPLARVSKDGRESLRCVHVNGSAHPGIWYSSLADLTPRIDPHSVVIGPARRSEFQSKLAGPPEGLRRITRRERHGSGYVRKASASRGGKHR